DIVKSFKEIAKAGMQIINPVALANSAYQLNQGCRIVILCARVHWPAARVLLQQKSVIVSLFEGRRIHEYVILAMVVSSQESPQDEQSQRVIAEQRGTLVRNSFGKRRSELPEYRAIVLPDLRQIALN